MPVPGPGGEKAREIQRIGTYIETRVPGPNGVQMASDYEKFAAGHPHLSAPQTFLAWMFRKLGPKLGASLGLSLGASAKAANQIAHGTTSGLDKVGQNAIFRALGEIENLLLHPPSPANLLSGLNAIGDFFARLTEPSTWIRVAEVAGGGLILYLGLKAVVTPGGQNVARRTARDTATSIGSKVAGVVAPESKTFGAIAKKAAKK